MKKNTIKKTILFAFSILILSFLFIIPSNCYAEKVTKITVGEKITETSLYDKSQNYELTLKRKTKVKISVMVEDIEIEDIYEDDEDDEKEFFLYEDYAIDFDFENEDDDSLISWVFLPGKTKSKTLVLDAGKYIFSAYGEGLKSLKYSFQIEDVSKYATKLSIPSKATIRIGQTKKLKTTLSPKKAYNKGITWKSSNKKIATVSKDGTVMAKSKGTCTITAVLKGGNTVKCKITVPSPNLLEKIYSQKFYISVYDFYVDDIGSSICEFGFFNEYSKDVTYVEFTAFQYDNKGDRVPNSMFSGSNFILNDTIKAKSAGAASYYVSDYAHKIRVCVKKIWYKDGKTWTNPLYSTWYKKYKNKY